MADHSVPMLGQRRRRPNIMDQEQAQRGDSSVWWKVTTGILSVAVFGLLAVVCLQYSQMMVLLQQNKEIMDTMQDMKIHIQNLQVEKEEYVALLKKLENKLSETEEQNEKLVDTLSEMKKHNKALSKQMEYLQQKALQQNYQGNSYTDSAKTVALGLASGALGSWLTGGLAWGGKAGIYVAGELGSQVARIASGVY